MLRDGGSLTERVANILATLDELKTAQFTSQDSGMKFIYADQVSGTIPINSSQRVTIATNTFVPEHGRPVISIPSYTISSYEYSFQRYDDFSVGYTSYQIYSPDGATYLGSIDVWPFYHLSGSGDGSYSWQTIIYTQGSQTMSIPLTIELRATDTGEHTLTMETLSL